MLLLTCYAQTLADCCQIIVNHKSDKTTPRFDAQLIFDEIGVALDNNQYRDIISLLDMYHVYLRQRQVSVTRYILIKTHLCF